MSLVPVFVPLHSSQRLTFVPENRLGGLGIDDKVAEAIANALKTNSSLKLLSLGQNEITAEGARHLGMALAVNRSLEALK